MPAPAHRRAASVAAAGAPAPIQICLLGTFQLLKAGVPIVVHPGSKSEQLLAYLGLHIGQCLPRDLLLQLLWPDGEVALASQSLRSLLHRLQQQLGDALGGAPLIMHRDGCYQLNARGGVATDVAQFAALLHLGDQQRTAGALAAAATYQQAIALYRGDLHRGDDDLHAVITREHLRAHYLALLLRLATVQFDHHDYPACAALIQQLLRIDPCYEHAHRLLMRCYVRLGQRSIALRHYRVCADILHREFATTPEPDTTALFDQIRREPGRV